MKEKWNKEKAVAKWDKYYHKKNWLARMIDVIIEIYFSKVFEKDLKRITKGIKGDIIELGCGSGIMSSRLAKQGYNVSVLDISQNALNAAKQNFGKLKAKGAFIKADLFSMKLKKESYGIVWNQGVIEHFDDIEGAVREMNRLVAKNGYLMIFVPAYNSPLHMVYRTLSLLNLKSLWPFDDQIFLKKKQLFIIMENAGVKSIRVRRVKGSLFFSLVGYSRKFR